MPFWNGIFVLSAQSLIIPAAFVAIICPFVLFAALPVGMFAEIKRPLAKIRASLGSCPMMIGGFAPGVALLDIILLVRVILHSPTFTFDAAKIIPRPSGERPAGQ